MIGGVRLMSPDQIVSAYVSHSRGGFGDLFSTMAHAAVWTDVAQFIRSTPWPVWAIAFVVAGLYLVRPRGRSNYGAPRGYARWRRR